MTVYLVYSDTIEFTKANEMYTSPCVQAVFNTKDDADDYCLDLVGRMNTGSYAHEEYPYIKSFDVRN